MPGANSWAATCCAKASAFPRSTSTCAAAIFNSGRSRRSKVPFVKIEKGLGPQGRIAVVRFDRGDNINALSQQAMRELRDVPRESLHEHCADAFAVALAVAGRTR